MMQSFAAFRQWLLNNLWHGEQVRMSSDKDEALYALISPNLARVWGPDTSHWDRNVDFSVTKARGASFVFIKAIDGTIQNSYFVPNRQRAKDAGLLHAPYGWLYRDVNVSCVAQAQAYSRIVQQYPSDLPPVIDFEWTSWGGSASNPTFADLDKWATEWLRLGNRKPLLYSAAGYMNSLGTIPATLKAKFAGIWIAHYGVSNPMMPYGYGVSEWIFHQFTASGDAATYAPNDSGKLEVDLNYFNGTLAQLYALAGQSVPDGGDMQYIVGTAKGSVTIRQTPAGDPYIPPRYLVAGDKIKASEVVDARWLKLVEINGKPADGWASAGATQQYISWNWVTEPPPPDPEPEPSGVADMPFTITLGGGDSPYVAQTIAGVIKAK